MRTGIAIAITAMLLNSALATDDKATFQLLARLSSLGVAAEKELSRISTNQAIAPELRIAASAAWRDHDSAGTNSLNQLQVFISSWTITNEPPLNQDTIDLLKQSVEFGTSALKQLRNFQSDTNTPQIYREAAADFLKAIHQ